LENEGEYQLQLVEDLVHSSFDLVNTRLN